MKKMILLMGILALTSLAHGNPLLSEQATWGAPYGVNSGTILYYPVGLQTTRHVNVKCMIQDYAYNRTDASFEFINDGLTWTGPSAGIYNLNSLNNYKITIILTDVSGHNPEVGGNIIFISKSKPKMQFLVQCVYIN